MKNILFITALFFSSSVSFGQLTISGIYSGKNIFVQNPILDDDSSEFCTDRIVINDLEYAGNYNTAAFEIKLDLLEIELGDSVKIIIYHKKDCKPLVLNGGCVITQKK